MQEILDVAIIGGGYSALVLCCELNKKSKLKIALFERLDRVGKKILSTGNGRCNLTNQNISVENYYGKNRGFVKFAIEKFGYESVCDYFAQLGVLTCDENGKVYPLSLQANSVLDALRFSTGNVKLNLNSEIIKIEKISHSGERLFKLTNSSNADFIARKVVLAFGASSQKQFGTDGKAFSLAKKLGHTITPLSPSLVQMRSDDKFINSLKGVKASVKLSLVDFGKEIGTAFGDLLFSQGGISGNTVFSLSAKLSLTKRPEIYVDFVPKIDVNRLIEHLNYKKRQYSQLSIDELLTGVLHKQIGRVIAKSITQAKLIGEVSEKEIIEISQLIKNFKINISGTLGFDYSQVTSGGISTDEISDKTFESKIVSGLYVIGEALDVDGDCGGYNLHWAFASAMCASEALCKE